MVRVGLKRVNITPPIGTPLGGYIARKGVSQGIHDDLYANALVLESREVALALVTSDLIGLPQELVHKIRLNVQKLTGIPSNHVLVAATHTHSGPDILMGYQGMAPEAYVEVLMATIVGSVYAAWRNLHPGEIGVGQGWIEGIGKNRRTPTGTPVDPRVGVLTININKKLHGILINYTCHPVVLGPDNLFITADYPGYTVRVIERALEGVMAMFTNGAAGDINTGHSAEHSALGERIAGRTFDRAEKLGTMLAGEVLKVLGMIEPNSNIAVAVRTREISLPLKPLPSLEEAEAFAKQKEQTLNELLRRKGPSELITKARVEKLYADLLLERVRKRSQHPHETFKYVELQAVRIGDCALLAFPGELFVEIGLEIKTKSPFKYTFIIGYANGYVGYVPTKQAFTEGGYEVVATDFAPEAHEIIVEESLELLNALT
ncbi:MAG: neutral/alkaline non-lysosomal ceramidase N-terminal domain-containing protein [Methanomassiliicoccales archaeon]|nr:neutral/alkaline non-lysosomal ceramidase N-terminal domain-containing protein [Methanomassiliicoccales archaeon]